MNGLNGGQAKADSDQSRPIEDDPSLGMDFVCAYGISMDGWRDKIVPFIFPLPHIKK